MNSFKQIMAAGLALVAISAGANAQVIGGEVNIDGSRDDVTFIGGELDIRGEIDGDIFAISGDGRIDAIVHGDVEFFGGDIDLSGEVDGSVEIAGGDVNISARIGDDLNAAGGDVTIEGETGGSLHAAGGSVRVTAIIGGDLRAAGGDVMIEAATEVAGDSRVVAGAVDYAGAAHGDADIEGGQVTLSGVFDGNVEVRAERVFVSSTARIDGALTVRSPVDPEIAEGAMIATMDYQYEAFNFGAKHWDDLEIDFDGPWKVIGAPFRFFGGMFAGSAFLLGMLAVLVAPRGVASVAAAFRRRPLSAGVIGFISLAMSPVVFVMITILLALTLVGALLIPLLWLLYFPALFLAFAFGGVAVGDLIFNRNGTGLGFGMRAVSLLLVMAVVFALGVVPGLGATVGVLILCVGLGAWILAIGHRRDREPGRSDVSAPDAAITAAEG
jgi:cytoskeletal protein CcmA (bactofilin family)